MRLRTAVPRRIRQSECVSEVGATEAARRFAELLDAIEHRGDEFTIVRRGKAIAHLTPVAFGRGAAVKRVLRRRPADDAWTAELAAIRELVQP